MANTNSFPTSQTQAVDLVFAQLDAFHPAETPPWRSYTVKSHAEGSKNGGGPHFSEAPQPPPPLQSAEDMQAAYQWLQAERQRLEEYTRNQMAYIQGQHQDMLAKLFRSEEHVTLRYQEINRERQLLAAQSEALQKRSAELGQLEQSLASHVQELAVAKEKKSALVQASDALRQEIDGRRQVLEQLHPEVARLKQVEVSLRTELETVHLRIQQERQAWEKDQADLATRQSQVEQRYRALEANETAAQRRMKELEEWEERLHRDCEQQDKQLAAERRELDALRAQIIRERTDLVKLRGKLLLREQGRSDLRRGPRSLTTLECDTHRNGTVGATTPSSPGDRA
jgi:chromosome segregation ATPase